MQKIRRYRFRLVSLSGNDFEFRVPAANRDAALTKLISHLSKRLKKPVWFEGKQLKINNRPIALLKSLTVARKKTTVG